MLQVYVKTVEPITSNREKKSRGLFCMKVIQFIVISRHEELRFKIFTIRKRNCQKNLPKVSVLPKPYFFQGFPDCFFFSRKIVTVNKNNWRIITCSP